MAIINFEFPYIPNPEKSQALAFAQLYVGTPDLDPQIPINQVPLYVVQEDGTRIQVDQPFIFSAGGTPVYNESSVRLEVDGEYSLKILDKNGAQVYYIYRVEESSGGGGGGGATYNTLEEILNDSSLSAGDVVYAEEREEDNGGGAHWSTVNTADVTPNDLDIVTSTVKPSISFQLVYLPVNSVRAFGAKADGETDDFAALTRLHDLGFSYTLEGKVCYTSETLTPKSGQNIYPDGGGIRKGTAGYMFSYTGGLTRFVIHAGGKFDGMNVASFIYASGDPGYGNGWTEWKVDGRGENFVTGFFLENARAGVVEGRWTCHTGVIYRSKTAEIEFRGTYLVANVNTSETGETVGIRTEISGVPQIGFPTIGTDFPEGLVYIGGLVYGFNLPLHGLAGFEMEFIGTEFAGQNATNAGALIEYGGSTQNKGWYFTNCRFSHKGIQFANGTDGFVQEYNAILTGCNFRSMTGAVDVYIRKFAHRITVTDSSHETSAALFCISAEDKNEGINVTGTKVRGSYTRITDFAGDGENIIISNIGNPTNLDTPHRFVYPVNYSNLEGYNFYRDDGLVAAGTYDDTTSPLMSQSIETLPTGTYALQFGAYATSASGNLRLQFLVSSLDAGTFVIPGGSGGSSEHREMPDSAQRIEVIQTFIVTKAGQFRIESNVDRGSVTLSGAHNFYSVYRIDAC